MHTFVTMTENTRWMIVDDDEQILLRLAAVIQRMTQAEVESYNSPQAALAVIASAARPIAVRQCCRVRKSIAEISVPACATPTHQTKLMMSQPHMTG